MGIHRFLAGLLLSVSLFTAFAVTAGSPNPASSRNTLIIVPETSSELLTLAEELRSSASGLAYTARYRYDGTALKIEILLNGNWNPIPQEDWTGCSGLLELYRNFIFAGDAPLLDSVDAVTSEWPAGRKCKRVRTEDYEKIITFVDVATLSMPKEECARLIGKYSADARLPFPKRAWRKFLIFLPVIKQIAGGLLVSAELFILTLLVSLPLGLLIAFGRMSSNVILKSIAKVYISIMRGTPLMLQLLLVYFGPYYIFGCSLEKYPAFMATVIAFGLNYAAYFAEIYRGGIESIPVGQHEAAFVLGFSKGRTFFEIILPQVVKRILPPVTNEVITLVKDTSLAQVIAVTEMFTIGKQIANAHASIAPLLVAGVFYYVFNFIVAYAMERIEKSLSYYR